MANKQDLIAKVAEATELTKKDSAAAVEAGLVQSGDDIVIVAGVPVGEAVRTNTMRIRTVR